MINPAPIGVGTSSGAAQSFSISASSAVPGVPLVMELRDTIQAGGIARNIGQRNKKKSDDEGRFGEVSWHNCTNGQLHDRNIRVLGRRAGVEPYSSTNLARSATSTASSTKSPCCAATGGQRYRRLARHGRSRARRGPGPVDRESIRRRFRSRRNIVAGERGAKARVEPGGMACGGAALGVEGMLARISATWSSGVRIWRSSAKGQGR
jgi:hypothetical protein